MTFEEAHELLNGMEVERVGDEMRDWHPAVLSEMLRAVQHAKVWRYSGHHPSWDEAVTELATKAALL